MIATKRISAFTAGAANKVRNQGKSYVDESHAIIISGGVGEGNSQKAAIALSDDEAEEDGVSDSEPSGESVAGADEEDEEEEEKEEEEEVEEIEIGAPAQPAALANGVNASDSDDADVEMSEVGQGSGAEDEKENCNAEPSFGDLIAAKSAKPISIADAFPSADAVALVTTESGGPVAFPTGVSLATVLAQALRTNDNNLLESCFHNTDTQIIRSTIQRIDSSLAGILIQSLAERLSTRPGRYGHLLVWIQWICVAHGSAIGGRPEVLSKVKMLYKVLNQRSKALDALLLLKGKLDMLDAQLGLRKQLIADRGLPSDPDAGHVVYIEGDEDGESSDEDEAIGNANTKVPPKKIKDKKNLSELIPDVEEDSEDEEDMPTTNGIIAETDVSDYDSDNDDDGHLQQHEGGLVDDEAEESDGDSHPSDREDEESEQEDGSDDDEQDSEMNDFIDDGSVEEIESASEVSIESTPEKPPSKKSRRA